MSGSGPQPIPFLLQYTRHTPHVYKNYFFSLCPCDQTWSWIYFLLKRPSHFIFDKLYFHFSCVFVWGRWSPFVHWWSFASCQMNTPPSATIRSAGSPQNIPTDDFSRKRKKYICVKKSKQPKIVLPQSTSITSNLENPLGLELSQLSSHLSLIVCAKWENLLIPPSPHLKLTNHYPWDALDDASPAKVIAFRSNWCFELLSNLLFFSK